MRADVRGKVVGLDHLVGLAELVQATPVGIQHGDTAIFYRGLVLAAGFHLTIDVVALHQVLEQGLAGEIQFQADLRRVDIADVVIRPDIVGQVNGKTGVSAGGAEADFLCFDKNDFVFGEVERQLPGGGETGEAGTYHDPARRAFAEMAGPWLPRFAEVVPTTGLVIGR
ncbi:hypothetical protein D3C84_285390 [compost metagenome]